ncbi:Fe-only nitrogenase accessory protein AnfO [Clostridium sp. LBM24168]
MNKEIAVLVNDHGEVTSFLEPSVVNIYIMENNHWEIKNRIVFQVDVTADINLIRQRISKMVKLLGECKIFVATEIVGIPYNILERFGINSWEINGKPDEFLNYIIKKESEEEKKLIEESFKHKNGDMQYIVKNGEDGKYFIDFIEIQNNNPNITTKKILLPFFKEVDFFELTIRCNHIPGWFQRELYKFNLRADVQKNNMDEIEVIVKHEK